MFDFIEPDVVSPALGIWPALSGFPAEPCGSSPLVSAPVAGVPVVACANAGPASITPATASATVIFQLVISDLLDTRDARSRLFVGGNVATYRERREQRTCH